MGIAHAFQGRRGCQLLRGSVHGLHEHCGTPAAPCAARARSLRLPAYWAHCEQYVLGDVAAAREVWESTLKGGLGRCGGYRWQAGRLAGWLAG